MLTQNDFLKIIFDSVFLFLCMSQALGG